MTEIGQVYGLGNQVRSAGAAKNEKALSAPTQLPSIESAGTPRQARLPVEDAIREVARGVTDYIVTSRLTRDEGYQAFKAELISNAPLTLLSVNEMKLIEDLSQALLDKVAMNPLNIPTTELAPLSVAQISESLMAGNMSDTLGQILNRISPALSGASALAEAGLQEPEIGREQSLGAPIGEAPIGSEQQLVMSWTLGSSVVQGNGVARDTGNSSIPGGFSDNGLLGRPPDLDNPPAAVNGLANGSEIVLNTQLFEGGQTSAGNTLGSSFAAPVIAGVPQQSDPHTSIVIPGQSPNSSDLLRVDLKEILAGKPAELRIRYDEPLIVSKVAVLLAQVNGLPRVYEGQDKGASYSRQKPSSDLNRSLQQVIAAALGIVVDGNKPFSTPASVGVSAGRDGLLVLDTTILRSALESHRDETVSVLKSLANSFYDNISLFVDPRIPARFSELLGIGVADKAGRSRKESERRWKKDRDFLEKRFLELALYSRSRGSYGNGSWTWFNALGAAFRTPNLLMKWLKGHCRPSIYPGTGKSS
ncbi:MAG TPA: hypothetical protein VLX12_11785 [Syntrophorhabdales bacterium]|nr:hypothetical protein [Syntrophorhabdales bacterium]